MLTLDLVRHLRCAVQSCKRAFINVCYCDSFTYITDNTFDFNKIKRPRKLSICKRTYKDLRQIVNLNALERFTKKEHNRGSVFLLNLLFGDGFSPFSGYFVQDAGDIILTGHARGSWEFLLHHALVRLVFLATSCSFCI